jgi:RND family efflux transporter MFP subunit
MRAFFHILIPLVILSLGFGAFVGLKGLKKMGFKLNKDKNTSSAASSGKKERPKIKTRVIALEKKDYTVQIQSQGMIRTHNATTLTAQVSGRVARLSPQFEDGAYFNEGDVLLEIDKADYLTDRESSKAQVARAEASYAQELARAKQALLNWRDAGFKEDASDLVLRKPQLREAEANVNSAKSSLERAERNLTRTQVKAPYDGRVRKRNVGLGQQVGASTPLGDIFSTDFAEVRLPLTTRDLTYYTPPNKPEETSTPHRVSFNSILTPHTEGEVPQWEGRILRAEGELDEQSRQLFIIARIDDPFGLTSEKPPLFIGQPVRASIPAQILKGVYTIPRSALSELNEILISRDGKLKRVNIAPVWSTEEHVIIREGVEPSDLVTTTRLPYAPEGAEVEILTNPVETEPSQSNVKNRRGRKGGHGHGH